MEKGRFYISKISCEHCKKTIEEALSRVEGIVSISVETASKTVEVEFEGSVVTEDKINRLLSETGYPRD